MFFSIGKYEIFVLHMVRVLSVLLVIFPVVFYLMLHNKSKCFFAPKNIFTFLYVVEILLPLLSFVSLSNVNSIGREYLKEAMSDDGVFFEYCFLQSMSYCIVLLGIRIFEKRIVFTPQNKNVCRVNNYTLYKRYHQVGVLLLIIGTYAFMLIMSKIGGVVYFFTNLQMRRYLVQDLDFESMLLGVLRYAPLLIVYSKRFVDKKINVFDVIVIVLSGIMVGMGGRKALIMLCIEVLMICHFVIKEIKIKDFLKLKYVVGLGVLYMFFSFYSTFRTPDAMNSFSVDPISYISENSKGVGAQIRGESYVPFYTASIYYVKENGYWYGKSFLGLLTAPIPSSFFAEKPPVDDGMYLYSICNGRNVEPIMPTKLLDGSSLPLETFGAMYLNFGPLGVLFGMFVVGLMIGFSYYKMVKNNMTFMGLLMYVVVVFTFEVSTLRIFQTIIAFGMLYIISKIVEWGLKKEKREVGFS